MRRLFWLVNDFLYAISRGRVDLDDVLRVRDDIVARLVDKDVDDVDHIDVALVFAVVGAVILLVAHAMGAR